MGIMEKNMETTFSGFRVCGLGFKVYGFFPLVPYLGAKYVEDLFPDSFRGFQPSCYLLLEP